MFAPAALAALLVISLTALPLLGAQTTGYPGFWLYGSEYDTPHAGQPDVVSLLVDKALSCVSGAAGTPSARQPDQGSLRSMVQESPCRYDGTICVKSMNTYSEPGEFVHDTGRTLCLERVPSHFPNLPHNCEERAFPGEPAARGPPGRGSDGIARGGAQITLDTCVTRMINASLADRVDPLRELLLYPSEDGHSSTTMVSGSRV
ncbi:hypothetical protein T484DRAFT_1807997 [Baffinella frigidus]|nr:hypothetical protein T484DRAFT_1807997 [Cryptophyta sp. CCMP2293]